MKKPFLLVILDGWGFSKHNQGNPLSAANLPTYKYLLDNYPSTLLQASGQSVGLSWGEPGNSEVGHLSLGAGRIVPQYKTRIDKAISENSFINNPAISKIMSQDSRVHLIGLLTSGTVHASLNHLLHSIGVLDELRVKDVFIHLFLDGRDSGLKEAPALLKQVEKFIDEKVSFSKVTIASLIGRNIAMNRTGNWESTKKVFDLIGKREGNPVSDFYEAINQKYTENILDADMSPFIKAGLDDSILKTGDTLFFINFREDSMRQIAHAFSDEKFDKFGRNIPDNLHVITMTQYFKGGRINPLFYPPKIPLSLSEVLSVHNLKQLHIAEKEKYAHVTYFFNGLKNEPFEGEIDHIIESVKDVEKIPEMSSGRITDKILSETEKGEVDFILVNFANADILAHTGNYNGAIRAVEAIDASLGRIYTMIEKNGGTMAITADHGNVESMIYSLGDKESKHNSNPVPFILVKKEYMGRKGKPESTSGILADVAPTVLELMNLEKPENMRGESLLRILKI